MILDANNDSAILRKYTWGLGLSSPAGTASQNRDREGVAGIHSAGGIGGLLAVEEPQAVGDPERYWYLYDANGNVGQVIDASDSSIAARYRYDPYGNIVGPDDDADGDWRDDAGPYALANPYRFSTKWLDDELIHDTTWVQSAFSATGMYYYGYRYYSPHVGRWISRDPIQELGGTNLYGFVQNNPGNHIDADGRHRAETNCYPDGFGPEIKVDPTQSRCRKACSYVHEAVHYARSAVCCRKYQRTWQRAAGDPAEQAKLEKRWNTWVLANNPLEDCEAYLASMLCSLASLANPLCCTEFKLIKEDAILDRVEMIINCRDAMEYTDGKFAPCPSEFSF